MCECGVCVCGNDVVSDDVCVCVSNVLDVMLDFM